MILKWQAGHGFQERGWRQVYCRGFVAQLWPAFRVTVGSTLARPGLKCTVHFSMFAVTRMVQICCDQGCVTL
jgi:hypothetical protein